MERFEPRPSRNRDAVSEHRRVTTTWTSGRCCEPVPLWGFLRKLTFVAPFADEVEAALEERIVGRRRGSGQGEDGGGEGCGRFDGLVFGVGFGLVGWHRGEDKVVRIGELPGVVGWGLMK